MGKNYRPTLTATESFIRPDAWGQVYWAQIHLSSFFAFADPDKPTKDEQKLLNLYYRYILPAMLPCAGCRSEYIEWIETNTCEDFKDRMECMLQNRDNLILGLYLLHESVNKRLGKKGITCEKFFKKYEHLKSQYCAMDTPQYDKQACVRHLGKKFFVREGRSSDSSARKIRTEIHGAEKKNITEDLRASQFQFHKWRKQSLADQSGLMSQLLNSL